MARLPIDVIPRTRPVRFTWWQTVTTPTGTARIHHTGSLPVTLEGAMMEMVALVKDQAEKIDALARLNDALTARVAVQSELLSKKAEATSLELPAAPQPSGAKKGRGA